MHDDAISQAEIDALVRGMTGQSEPPAAAPAGGTVDTKLLQEPMREYVLHAGRSLADLVGVPSTGNLVEILATTCSGLENNLANQILVGRSNFSSGLSGTFYFVVPLSMGLAMITQIYGGVAPSTLDESAMGALSDGLTQMNQSGMAALTEQIGRPLFAEPVEVLAPGTLSEVVPNSTAPVVAVGFDLTVGDDSGRIYAIFSQDAAGTVTQAMKDRQANRGRAPSPAPASHGAPSHGGIASARAAVAAAVAPAPAAASPFMAAQFPDLSPKARPEEARNIDLLMDVSLQVTVELGRTRRQIRDVLSLGPGSVLELDKLAGEQVDVLVNGKLIAKGEVVVIDENYGVRITDIISPVDRVQSLK